MFVLYGSERNNMSKKISVTKVAEGLGVAALAAAAAASYYFYGQGGKQRRRALQSWSKQAKSEMVAKIKQMKTVSERAYEQAAREVLAKYRQAKAVKPEELAALGKELKNHWSKIARDIKKLGQQPKAPAKKPSRKKPAAK